MSTEKPNNPVNVTKSDKADFELHVRLIMQGGVKIADARAAAYLQGPTGLKNMLGKLGQAV